MVERHHMEQMVWHEPSRFADFMNEAVVGRRIKDIRIGTDLFLSAMIQTVEQRMFGQLKETAILLSKLTQRLARIMDELQPGVCVELGRLDAGCRIYSYFADSTPEAVVLAELYGKYDRPILNVLYREFTLSMTDLAERIQVAPPYLTEVIQRLVDFGFVERSKRGKSVYCTLAVKGTRTARFMDTTTDRDSMLEMLSEALEEKDEQSLEQWSKRYRATQPAVLRIEKEIKKSWKEISSTHERQYVSIISKSGWNDFPLEVIDKTKEACPPRTHSYK
ncbi:MarR family transcriptional regulator [Paenibacillus koleovorans]|uniref:MarR family transcriptional regulator n=1 Tax=Paenibacillus koleovorans TaxID=121608 RepID=UPI000FD8D0C5|nr:MarR family transcriptional regulator [Paenibacillus koleovorans]